MPRHQLSLNLIQHSLNDSIIDQRSNDGYINATELCNVAGKRWYNYLREESNGQFLRALSEDLKLSLNEIVQTGQAEEGGPVWVHPQVAINLGQWLSGDFAVKVSKWVFEWLNGGFSQPTKLPAHLTRYIENDHKIPTGYFSILQETTLGLVAPLHNLGFIIPEGWTPDISVGKLFCKWLREQKGVDTDSLPTYMHTYQDERGTKPAKIYPDIYLADCRTWFRTVWLPEHGASYFKRKDPDSLVFYDKIPALTALNAKKSLPPSANQ